ncbi:DUF4276 family protein [Cetobacterium sp.]|uniref:DUF4276 family protein n=1 Tax=Cetobacterium sp. TaxID=2071632 RepID=UPI003F2BFFE8
MGNNTEITPKKMCIFVEGQTEQIFIKKLLEEIIAKKRLTIILSTVRGGEKIERVSVVQNETAERKEFYIQIIDSGNDNSVVSDIFDNKEQLKNANFKKILGIRDLYPKELEEYEKLSLGCNKLLRTSEIYSKVHIIIREIETWFLKEYTHLERLDTRLTLEHIRRLGFDLENDNLEKDHKYSAPAAVLNEIYKSISKNYSKKKYRIERLVNELDYEKIYTELREKLPILNELLNDIDEFFS